MTLQEHKDELRAFIEAVAYVANVAKFKKAGTAFSQLGKLKQNGSRWGYKIIQQIPKRLLKQTSKA